jgi:hypothetical protein
MRLPKLVLKGGRFAWWHGYVRWIHPLAEPLAARWGWATRLIRWPLPWLAPFRQKEIRVVRAAGLGDVLMCTLGLRELKRRNPACHVTLYTRFQDLVAGLPFIDLVRPDAESPAGTIWLYNEKTIPPAATFRSSSATILD